MAIPCAIPAVQTAIPVYAAGTHAGTWHAPLPAHANDQRVLIKAGDGSCWVSLECEHGPRLHFDAWADLMHLAGALKQRGRADVLTFLPAEG